MRGKFKPFISKEWTSDQDKKKSEMTDQEKREFFPKHDTKDIINVLEYAMQLHLRKTQVDERELLQFKFGNPAKTYHLVLNPKKIYESTKLF